jgi:LacI family transcriptional regulator
MSRKEEGAATSRVTLQDVADHAGVSQATAGRALGGYGSISEDARSRVEQAAVTLGYRTNAVARALASGTTKSIGLVIGDIENPFFATVARGLSDVVQEAGYTVVLANADENWDLESRALEVLETRSVDGMVVAPAPDSDAGVLERLSERIPLIAVDRTLPGLDVDTVLVDNVAGAASATRHLVDLGHRDIGLVTEPPVLSSVRERIQGYEDVLEAHGLEPDPARVAVGTPKLEGGLLAAKGLLEAADRPQAIFATSNTMTAAVIAATVELGLRIPDDVSVVGFDDSEWMRLVSPPITVVRQPVYALGQATGRLLNDRINGWEGDAKQLRLKTELVVRESCSKRESAK